MIIAISGLSGSGKNTLGESLVRSLGFKLVCPTFKDLAEQEGISLMEFQEKAARDPTIDKKFDDELRRQARGDCIVTTWLGPWMLNADIRIYAFAPLTVRAERVAKRDNISVQEAEKHIKERDEQNRARYKKIYGIDIYDTSNFDISINSANFSKDEVHALALNAIEIKKSKR